MAEAFRVQGLLNPLHQRDEEDAAGHGPGYCARQVMPAEPDLTGCFQLTASRGASSLQTAVTPSAAD